MPIGRGAYGIVCSILNTDTNEMVAVKKIANAFDNYMDAKRTLREIKLLRHLDHENVSFCFLIDPILLNFINCWLHTGQLFISLSG